MSDDVDILRHVPPHDELAEQAILASVLERPSIFAEVRIALEPDDFYRESHRAIYRAMLAPIDAKREPIDAVTLIDMLRTNGDLESIGGGGYVTEMLARTADIIPSHAPSHARLIHELATQRALASAATDIASRVYDGGENSRSLIADAQTALDRLRERQVRERKSTADVLHETIASLDDVVSEARATGFRSLNREVAGGFRAGELIVVAAPTGRAKSTLALSIAANMAKAGRAAVFFSLEMTERELARRLLFADAQVDHLAINDLRPAERERLLYAAHDFAVRRLAIEYRPKLSPAIVRAVAQGFRREWGALDLVVADYVQLMGPDARQQNREREVASITRELKCVAGELDSRWSRLPS